MASLISPGVQVAEIDLTTIVPTASTTDGAFAGQFAWGPLNDNQLITSEDELRDQFGKPDENTFISFFTAANFLAYGNKLNLVRVADETAAKNATADAAGLLIKNDEHYLNSFANGQGSVGLWAGKHPGKLGNSLRVSICPSSKAFKQDLLLVSSSGTALSISGGGFVAALVPGSVIIDPSGNERVIASVTDDNNAVLVSAFPSNLSSVTVKAKWEYADDIGQPPTSSGYALARGGADDEIHVVVVDEDGVISGVRGSVLERFGFLSKAGDAKSEDGTSIYYAASINNRSKFIRWMDHLPAGTNWGSLAAGVTFTAVDKPNSVSLAGGADGGAVAAADRIRGFDLFKNKENLDISLVLGGDAPTAVAIHIINNICEYRKDCIGLLSVERDDVVNNSGQEVEDCVQFRNTLPSSSYAVLDCNWKYQYDKYNDTFRWIPCNGDVAGLCVRTDIERDAWWSPAGFNRGGLKNVIRLAFNPDGGERDVLYINGINPIVQFPGQGAVLYGDKTLLSKPSAFDRINVRRLFIVLEKSIEKASRFTLFEINDESTRQAFKALVEPYLRDVKGRRGITDFRVVCDSSNNTAEVIDRNEFIGDIYIKPSRSINFIRLNFVAVRTGVEFSEIVGKF
jgi:hypothetical protein